MCYGVVKPCVVFSAKKMLSAIRKDAVPTIQQSMVIYQCVCRCNGRYAGRTSQRLQDRIKQHVPESIRSTLQPERLSIKRQCKSASQLSPASYPAIGQHLLENKDCTIHYDDKQFSILANGRSHFRLSTLQATYIKTLKPELCRQKEFVYILELAHLQFGLLETF